jgi:DNA-binding SARP family transcriptional activator
VELHVELYAGLVRRDGEPVALNRRERTLLFTLAAARRPISRDDLLEELWPDLETQGARNALGVCLHRLRQRLGDPGAVVRSIFGYSLGFAVRVDLWEIEDLLGRIRGAGRPALADRSASAHAFASILAARGPGVRPLTERLSALGARLDAARGELGCRLAADALDRGDADAALAHATAVADADPCDEPARVLAIRAHLRRGDRPSAIREFRSYQRRVSEELGVLPSIELRRLLEERVDASASRTVLAAAV